MKKIIILAMMLFLNPFHSFAHEGHNKTPGAISAPHGGQIKGTDSLYLELISDSQGFKIYPLSHEMKSLPLKDVLLDVKLKFPKKSAAESIKLSSSSDFWEAKVNSSDTYRYSVEIKITYGGKKEHLTFTVEPQ